MPTVCFASPPLQDIRATDDEPLLSSPTVHCAGGVLEAELPKRLWRLSERRIAVVVVAAVVILVVAATFSVLLGHRRAFRPAIASSSEILGFDVHVDLIGASMAAFTVQFGGGDPYAFRCPLLAEGQRRLLSDVARGGGIEASQGDMVAPQAWEARPIATPIGTLSFGSENVVNSVAPRPAREEPFRLNVVSPSLEAADPQTRQISASSSSALTSVASCCDQYDSAGWPYQFPECRRNASRCVSCWKRSEVASRDEKPLTVFAGVAWAASAAVGSDAKVKKMGLLSKLATWMEDKVSTDHTAGLRHAELQSHQMLGNLDHGLSVNESVNLCPNVEDWHEYMLNDDAENVHARAYKSKSRKLAVIVFRGTQMDSMQNWRTDADILRIPLLLERGGPTALVHEGFFTALTRIAHRVRKWVEGFMGIFGDVPDDWNLIFTGHSLGGALATLAATLAEVQKWDRRPDGTITFGAPRVADETLDRWWMQKGLCDRILRVNVYNDLIHWLPSRHVSRLADAASRLSKCVDDLSECLFGTGTPAPLPSMLPWKHVCEVSELLVEGAMKGVNGDESDLSPFGGGLAHYLDNCLFGYGFGVLNGVIAAQDHICGLGPEMCR